MSEYLFKSEYAKTSRSNCKKCSNQIAKNELRLAKLSANPFSEDSQMMPQWYHPPCLFEVFRKSRITTKIIEQPGDIEGYEQLEAIDKNTIVTLISTIQDKIKSRQAQLAKLSSNNNNNNNNNDNNNKNNNKRNATTDSTIQSTLQKKHKSDNNDTDDDDDDDGGGGSAQDDMLFSEFCNLCRKLENEPSYTNKTKLIAERMNNLSVTGKCLLAQMLLPGEGKDKMRIYYLKDRQLTKLFSLILKLDLDTLITETEDNGDVSITISNNYNQPKGATPQTQVGTLTLKEIGLFLDKLSQNTTEKQQIPLLEGYMHKLSCLELKYLIRLIKKDVKTSAGVKCVMATISNSAYAAFQANQDIEDVITRAQKLIDLPSLKKDISIRASLMVAIKPMLAEACKSYATALKKCPNGFYAEIKYDGERVQVHKNGNDYKYYSRSLKPVQEHKIKEFRTYLPQALPRGNNMILDAEVLLMDIINNKPLPFGSLGKHKKNQFKDATMCLVIFDIMYLNDTSLVSKTYTERRNLLQKEITEIPNRIQLSQGKLILPKQLDKLEELMSKCIKQGLEGLVLKNINGEYEPGKRHWLKLKKDYLLEGSMADSADLLVLGAYYGTGNKGGLMSVFLMGVYDAVRSKWCTVVKAGNGLDDNQINKLQSGVFDMIKISKDYTKLPSWILCNKSIVPDYIVRDPKKSQVWEITGAEFSESTTHTADGISIRFPRITKIRDDKDWSQATDLARLKVLYETSKEITDIGCLFSPDEEEAPRDRTIVRKAKIRSAAAAHSPPAATSSFTIRDPLPDLFTGSTFQISADVSSDDRTNLARHIIAYDGAIADSINNTNIQYSIVNTMDDDDDNNNNNNKNNNNNGAITQITPEWIWEKIKSSS